MANEVIKEKKLAMAMLCYYEYSHQQAQTHPTLIYLFCNRILPMTKYSLAPSVMPYMEVCNTASKTSQSPIFTSSSTSFFMEVSSLRCIWEILGATALCCSSNGSTGGIYR